MQIFLKVRNFNIPSKRKLNREHIGKVIPDFFKL